MAETGVAVVAPMPNKQQQSHHDKTRLVTDSMSIAHMIAPVVPPSSEPSQSITQSHDIFAQCDANIPKKPVTSHEPTTVITTDLSPLSAPNPDSKEVDNQAKADIAVTAPSNDDSCSSKELQHNCSSNGQTSTIQSEQPQKKKRKYEETVIDGFAICAFKSWEDLQDELNERIATNLKNGHAAEKERDNNSIATKKKHKSKPKNPQSTPGDSTLLQVKKEKVKKSIKESDANKSKKGINGHPSTSGEAKVNNKKHKESNKAKDVPHKETHDVKKLAENKTSQSQKKFKGEDEQQRISDNNNNIGDRVNSTQMNFNQPYNPHSSQTPQVHPVHNQSETQSRAQASRLANDLLKEPSMPQSAPHPSFNSDSHLDRLYNVTSNIQPAIHNLHPHPGTQSDQNNIQQYSQSQQHIKRSPGAQQPQPHSSHLPKPNLQTPNYQGTQSPIYQQQNYHPPGMNQNQPFYHHHHPMHHLPAQGPYHPQTHPPSANMHQTNMHSSMPPQHNIRMQPTQNQYSQYQQHHHHQHPHTQQPQPTSHLPPFSMYSPQIPHHTQSSSMVASMSMSAHPVSYGSPYIVTDTTISRQTSIIPPPMPSALEQAAASSAASRFGHHPNMLHSMGAYNPAAAAAAASAQSHHHNPPPPYQSQLPTERSFMDLARGYNGQGGHIVNYHNMMNSSYPAPTSSINTANPYSLDGWPKMAYDHHQRVVSRYNSLYNNSAPPTLPDRTGFSRPPMFPASLFPPPF